MATFLAQQLKKLAVPQTSILLHDKSRPSLLFDPKEAAKLDRDTVYAIGITGLEELELLNPAFSAYEDTLFNESSKLFERSVQSKEANEKLDEIIRNFLTTLSPYLLLKPSHKAFEWLIHRFHIHMYNLEDIIACILPFHETKIFVRILQLLDLSSPASPWNWLEPLQKPGVPLAKSTLLTHCVSDLSFMKFVCDLVPNSIEVLALTPGATKTTISFCTVSIIGAFKQAKDITEEMVSQILPYILKGLKSEIEDYCASSFMILCQLVRKTSISLKLLDKLTIKLIQNVLPNSLKRSVVCLVVVFQYQSPDSISDKLLEAILHNKEFLSEIETLSEQFHLYPFLSPLFKKLVPKALQQIKAGKDSKRSNEEKMLTFLIQELKLEDRTVRKTVQLLLDYYSNIHKENKSEKLKEAIAKYLGYLENRYPTAVDKTVDKYVQSANDQSKKKIQKLLFAVNCTKKTLLGKKNDLIFLSIFHPNEARRIIGVKTLVEMVLEDKINNKAFIKECLLPRLKDDSPDVISAVLELKTKIVDVADIETMYNTLYQILTLKPHSRKAEWLCVQENVLKLLCNCPEFYNGSEKLKEHLLMTVLAFFITNDSSELKMLSSAVLNSEFAISNPFLNVIVNALKKRKIDCNEVHLEKWNSVCIEILLEALKVIDQFEQDKMLNGILIFNNYNGKMIFSTFIGFNLLCNLIEISKKEEKIVYASKSLSFCRTHLSRTTCREDDNLVNTIKALHEGKIPFSIFDKLLQCIIKVKYSNGSQPTSIIGTDSSKLNLSLFHFISVNANNRDCLWQNEFQSILAEFLKVHFKNTEQQLSFLSSLWVHHLENDKNHLENWLELQTQSFIVTCSVIRNAETLKFLFEDEHKILIMLISSLSNSDENIRTLILNCISQVYKHVTEDSNSFYQLLEYLLKHREEIEADEKQFPQLLAVWLTPALSDPGVIKKVSTRKSLATTVTDKQFVLKTIQSFCNETEIQESYKLATLLALKNCFSDGVLSELVKLFNYTVNKHTPVGKMTSLPASILREILAKFNSSVAANLLTGTDKPSFKVLETALKSHLREFDGESLQQIAVKNITKKLCASIGSSAVKQKLITLLLDAYINSEDCTKENLLWKALKKICVDAKLIAKELQINDTLMGVQTIKKARLARASNINEVETVNQDSPSETTLVNAQFLEQKDWKKIMALLEIIQCNENIEEVELLVNPLFELMKKSLQYESNPQLEYFRQLLLTCLHNCCVQLKNDNSTKLKLQEQQFQVELAVQCIRLSPNPQTQHHALLLLNLAATMFPEHVLHNIMAIFTFMGASLIRQDDSYSFQVIIKTVETIIPALMQASQCQQESNAKTPIIVAAVTQVFVDALPDIPPHRKLPLFSKLVSMLGPSKFLWFPLIQIFAGVATKPQPAKSLEEKSRPSLPAAVEFSIELCHSLNPALQLSACLKVLQFLSSLPDGKGDENATQFNNEFILIGSALFDAKMHSEKELRHFKYTAVSFVASLLSSKEFISQIVDLNSKLVSKLQVLYRQLLEATMQYLKQVAQQVHDNAQNPTFKFWKALQHKLYDLLEKVNSLLPSEQFISVIEGLLSHNLPSVARKAMEMLNSKLIHQQNFFNNDDIPFLLGLIKPLTKAAKGKHRFQAGYEKDDVIVNQQTALMSLKLICKMAASSHPSHFKKVLSMVIKLLRKSNGSPQLTSCILLCLAELCHNLKAHCLPYLNKFMPILLELMQDLETLESNELLLMSLVTATHRLVENLSVFLSSYLKTIVSQICKISATHSEDENGGKTALQQRLKAVKIQLATEVPGRVLLPVINSCYEELSAPGPFQNGIASLMFILKETLSKMEKKTMNTHLSELQNFFLKALNFRQSQPKNIMVKLDYIEGHVIDAMISFVLKLSESSFRPVFYKVFEWATIEEDRSKERILTFYRLTCSLADKLKSLFVLFASHFVKNSSDILQANNEAQGKSYYGKGKRSTEKSCQLLKYLLRTLYLCFLHDNKFLVDQECFDTLMQPLVDQIENQIGSEEQYQERITKYISPCLAQFAVAAADDTSWKPFNYQILLKTRHSSAKVRFAALEVLQDLVQKLGDDYMVLLPESIPFLAELMEDESFEVEQQCQSVVAKMEQILGEPLMKYF